MVAGKILENRFVSDLSNSTPFVAFRGDISIRRAWRPECVLTAQFIGDNPKASDEFSVRAELLIIELLTHKPFTVLQQFRPKFQPAHMLGLNTVAIEAGRVKRKF